jgi:hypothetical protein
MQKHSANLEQSIADGVSALRTRFPGGHVEWDLDLHDRFVIADIMFGPETPRPEWLDALGEILDRHGIKAVCPLEGARHEVVAAFEAAGYQMDAQFNAVRNGLSRRDEGAERRIAAGLRSLDHRFQGIHSEWSFERDGRLVLTNVQPAGCAQEERLIEYLESFAAVIEGEGLAITLDEQMKSDWHLSLMEQASFEVSDD